MTLPLSTYQLGIINAAAAGVAPAWRERFLAAVADQLTALESISDDDVRFTISVLSRQMFGAACGDE